MDSAPGDQNPPPQPARDYLVDYRVIKELGRGGQGIVYLAEDKLRGRKVALKVLREVGGEALGRLRREVEAAARLDHPGICQVYEAVLDGAGPYIVMRYVEGRSLAQKIAAAQQAKEETWIARPDAPGGVPPSGVLASTDKVPSGPSSREDIERVLLIIEKSARALHAAHEARVIHRDVKPSNIVVTPQGEPVILDFGLAQLEEGANPGLTRTGEIWGTPVYLSPEQLTPKAKIDARTDVWSLGVTLYECLTLRRPFDGATNNQIFHAIQEKEPVDPCALNRALPADVRVVLETALEKDRDRRYQTALAFAEDLKSIRERRAIAARPLGPVTKLSRWARRNPALAASLLFAFGLLTAGLVVTVGLLISRNTALHEKDDALFEKTKALSDLEATLRRSEGLRLLAESSAAIPRDPGLGLLLAIEGARLAPEKVSLVNGTVNEALSDLHEIRTLVGHRASVDGAEFSRDASRVVSISVDGDVRVWDVASGGTIGTYVHPSVVRATFTPKGDHVVSWSLKGTCLVWDAASRTATTLADAGALALSADGTRLLTLRGDETAVWNTETTQRIATLPVPPSLLVQVSFSPDGKRILTVLQDGRATVWDSETGGTIASRDAAFPEVRLPRFSQDGRQVVAFAKDKGGIWKVDEGTVVELEERVPDLISISFSQDGRRVLGLSRTSVYVWNAATGKALVLCGPEGELDAVRDLPRPDATFTHDGERVVGASCDGTAHVWSAATGEESAILSGHSGDVRFVAASPDGSLVVTSSSTGTLTMWDPRTWVQVAVLRGHTDNVAQASFSQDGALAVTASSDRTVRIWNSRMPFGAPILLGHRGAITEVRFSADGRLMLTASTDGKPRIWHAQTCEEVAVLRVKKNVLSPEFSPDGAHVVALCEDGTASLFESFTGTLVASLTGESNFCFAGFGMDGARVVTGSDDGTAHVFDARTGTEIVRLPGHEGAVHFVAICSRGTRVLTASEGIVRIWDLATASEVCRIPGGGQQLPVLSPDGERVVATSSAGEARIYDAAAGTQLARLPGTRHGSPMFSPDGRRLATECLDGMFRLWDVETALETAALPHDEGGRVQAFSPDGRRILTTTRDGTAEFWDVTTGRRVATVRGEGSMVTDALFSPDGRWVVVSSPDGTRVFDAMTAAEAWAMTRRYGVVKSVRFSPDGTWILAGYAGEVARLWPTDPLAKGRAVCPRELTLKELETHGVEERSSLESVMRLFDDTLTNEELVATLERREGLSPTLRRIAISAARLRDPRVVADKLRRRAWAVVDRPGAEQEQYAMAVKWIETALELDPGVEDGLMTLGAARYRAGYVPGALEKLDEALRSTERARTYARAKSTIFIAMAHAKRGEHSQAASALAEAHRTLESAGLRPPEDIRHLLAEAETVVGTAAAQSSSN
jgi:WD40 repeat protein/serine/threonine protein kinase